MLRKLCSQCSESAGINICYLTSLHRTSTVAIRTEFGPLVPQMLGVLVVMLMVIMMVWVWFEHKTVGAILNTEVSCITSELRQVWKKYRSPLDEVKQIEGES